MPDLTGILVVNKDPGWTSHDVVARLRRLSGQRRIGHAGTLDPMASGVLPVFLGRATRLVDLTQAGEKAYEADVALGVATDTDDAEGQPVAEAPVPPLTPAEVEATLARFRGPVLQRPPAYSAIKVGGQRAYAVARRGGALDLPPRPVTIHHLGLRWLRRDALGLDVRCSRGTYVRSLARDLAQALGTLGHLARLVRTAVGPFTLAHAHRLPEVEAAGVDRLLLPADAALGDTPRVDLDAPEAARLLAGQAVEARGLNGERVRVYDAASRLLAIASADGALLRPRIVLEARG